MSILTGDRPFACFPELTGNLLASIYNPSSSCSWQYEVGFSLLYRRTARHEYEVASGTAASALTSSAL